MKDNINTARTQVKESNQSIVSPVHVAQLLLRWWYTFTGGKKVTAKDWTVLVLCYWGSRHTMQFFMCARNTYVILGDVFLKRNCKGGTLSNKHPILNSNGNLKYTKIEGHTLERTALRLPKGFLMFFSMLISIIMLFCLPILLHTQKNAWSEHWPEQFQKTSLLTFHKRQLSITLTTYTAEQSTGT